MTNSLTLSEDKLSALGQEVTARYLRAIGAWGEILAFGAMLDQVEADLSANLQTTDQPEGGGGVCKFADTPPKTRAGAYVKGSGLRGFLKEFAPDVPETKAYRMRELTRATAEKHRLETSAFLSAPSDLTEAQQKNRAKALTALEDKSFHGAQLYLGLVERPKAKIHAQMAAARATLARGEELVVECCHTLSPQQQAWWAGISNPERSAYNEWSPILDFFEREKTEQSFMRLPTRDREMLRNYIRHFGEHLGVIRKKGAQG